MDLSFWSDTARNIEEKIGYKFSDLSLLALAFTHRSFVNEHRDTSQAHNERLEFLGDAILGMLISEHLYTRLADSPEGELSLLRSRLVEASSCARYTQGLQLEHHLLLGKGEQRNEGRGRESIHADLFEALIGAIYLDGGLLAAREFLFETCGSFIETILLKPERNWKAELQDFAQKKFQKTPYYEVVKETGPDHSKEFLVSVWVNDKELGTGTGLSKKEAQQAAAAQALVRLKVMDKLS